ncbi:MAG TPA: hypothetical protein VLH18_01395 [Candidatus Limnocylindrales bacterium]|nr:hypothetical protein [Candidatus Limnocylindrales bacterium]
MGKRFPSLLAQLTGSYEFDPNLTYRKIAAGFLKKSLLSLPAAFLFTAGWLQYRQPIAGVEQPGKAESPRG